MQKLNLGQKQSLDAKLTYFHRRENARNMEKSDLRRLWTKKTQWQSAQ